jgi:2-polyprenyl-3-methyl-5-hydroxy-6-metoxy-1,4-benzoquinol methylase
MLFYRLFLMNTHRSDTHSEAFDSDQPTVVQVGTGTMSSAMQEAKNYHRWILELIQPSIRGKTILEIGPGLGQYTTELQKDAAELTVTDIDPNCLLRLREKLKSGVSYVVSNLSQPNFPDVFSEKKFQTIICLNVLEHVRDDQAAIRNMADILIPGGVLLLQVPAHQACFGAMDALASHCRRYSMKAARALFPQAEWSILECKYINPIGAIGWFLNAKFSRPKTLSAGEINAQILFFDRYLAPASCFLSQVTKYWFGQSIWVRVQKTQKTISDFGEQWTQFTKNEGVYGQKETLQDIFGPLLSLHDLQGKKVAEIGSGTGRIVNMLVKSGATHVTAAEPSDAYEVLVKNTVSNRNRIRYVRGAGESLPQDDYDYVFSIGVVHHIADPTPTLQAAYRALRPGGKCLIWIYGKEGNEVYLYFARLLRAVTIRMPHWVLNLLTYIFYIPLELYIWLCHFLPLPMKKYMVNVLAKWTPQTKRLTIYDQLNPTTAYYYTEQEARALLERSGFVNVQLFHRHGYSWSVLGEKTVAGKKDSF